MLPETILRRHAKRLLSNLLPKHNDDEEHTNDTTHDCFLKTTMSSFFLPSIFKQESKRNYFAASRFGLRRKCHFGEKAQACFVTFDLSILFHFFNLEFVLGMEY